LIGALLRDARNLRRCAAALVAWAVLHFPLPWWGAGCESQRSHWRYLSAVVVEQSYCYFAVAALLALWWLLARRPIVAEEGAPEAVAVDAGTGGR
jgi:hypothetical protein